MRDIESEIERDSELSLYTVKDASRILKVTEQSIRNYIKDKRLVRIPRKDMVRFTKKSLMNFINGAENEAK